MPSSGFSQDCKLKGECFKRGQGFVGQDEVSKGRCVRCAEIRVVTYLWAWGWDFDGCKRRWRIKNVSVVRC